MQTLKSRPIALACLLAPACLYSQEATSIPARSPLVLFGRGVNIVVGAPRALAQASDSASVARALETCPAGIRGAFGVAYANEPTGVRGAARDDRVVFVLVPPSTTGVCDASAPLSPALLTRGVQIVAPSTGEPSGDVRGVEVSVRGRLVPTDSFARRPVVAIVPSSAPSVDRASQIATWISSEYLAPDPAGRLPEVTLQVSAADSSPDVVVLAGEALRDLWHDLVVARIEKLGDTPAAHAPMHVPVPTDKPLREAHVLYSSGKVVAGARIAEQRLSAGKLSAEDARAARMLIVGALLAYDDTSAARVVLTDVLADTPCLTLSDKQTERLIDAMRPPARCSVTPLRRVLLASLVPGMGHAVIGYPAIAAIGAGLTGAGVVMAWSFARNRDQAYRRYLAARSTPEVTTAYIDAVQEQRDARRALAGAATAWLVAGATAVLAERMHARSIARIHDYDLHPTVGFLPDAQGTEARLSMSVTW